MNLPSDLDILKSIYARATLSDRGTESLIGDLEFIAEQVKPLLDKAVAQEELRIAYAEGRVICAACGHTPHGLGICEHRNHGNALECGCWDGDYTMLVEKAQMCGLPAYAPCRNHTAGEKCPTHNPLLTIT